MSMDSELCSRPILRCTRRWANIWRNRDTPPRRFASQSPSADSLPCVRRVLLVDLRDKCLPLERRTRLVLLVNGRQRQRPACQVTVGNQREKVPDHVQPGSLLIVGIHHVPRRLFGICPRQHLVLRAGILSPVLSRLEIHGAELPPLGRVLHALLEPSFLFLIADREPVFDDQNSRTHEHALKLRTGADEFQVFSFAAEAHYVLNPRAVIPASIEQHHLACRGKVRGVSRELALCLLAFCCRAQRHHAANARIQSLCNSLDGSALAG